MTEQIEKYAMHLNASDEIISWIKTAAKNAIKKQLTSETELEHVVDFFLSAAAPKRLQKMSVVDAKRKAKEWSESNQKKGKDLQDATDDIDTIHDFLDGTKIVKLKTKKAYQREGFLMSHCSGGYDPSNKDCHIYSYRDAKNIPHATFEVKKSNNEIIQIKGKGNGAIHPKYIHPILAFLKAIGMEIRPNDMQNLGYYHMPIEHLDFLKMTDTAMEQITMINGEVYAR